MKFLFPALMTTCLKPAPPAPPHRPSSKQVVPFSPSSGLLEWVENTLPIAGERWAVLLCYMRMPVDQPRHTTAVWNGSLIPSCHSASMHPFHAPIQPLHLPSLPPPPDYLLGPNRTSGAHMRYKRPGDFSWVNCYQEVGAGWEGAAGVHAYVFDNAMHGKVLHR